MARPTSTDELKDFRFQMMFKPSEIETIDDWMFANRIRSRAEAIRRLIDIGLLKTEFEKRCAADPSECPSFVWETLCEERGIDPIAARAA